MTPQTRSLKFRTEADLEDYLVPNLPRYLSLLGLELLIIGRQWTTSDGRIDLLAIDVTGAIFIIELKVETAQRIIDQLLRYLISMEGISREQLIQDAARNPLRVDLTSAFEKRFGRPLPDTANHSQVLVVIAPAIHPTTARILLHLGKICHSTMAFRYVVASGSFSLSQRSLQEDEAEPPKQRKSRKRPIRNSPQRARTRQGYSVRADVEMFWRRHSQYFVSTVVTFKSVCALYTQSSLDHPAEGLRPLPEGAFGRELRSFLKDSDEWTHIYVPAGSDIPVYLPLNDPPTTRAYRDKGHRISAYRRTTTK